MVKKTHAHLNYDGDLLQRLRTSLKHTTPTDTRTHELIPIRTDAQPQAQTHSLLIHTHTLTSVNYLVSS